MSKEAGELFPGASPQPQRASSGYSRAAQSIHTATTSEMAVEDLVHRAVGDGSQIEARHRNQDAKENIGSALNPAYNYDKVCFVAAMIISLL